MTGIECFTVVDFRIVAFDRKELAVTSSYTQVERDSVTERVSRPRRQPRYNVVLWDDNDHSYGYVERMMKDLFHVDDQQAVQIAKTVDHDGRAICLTTTLEHAELKRDQIHAFGRDTRIRQCKGSMSSSIEPVPGD